MQRMKKEQRCCETNIIEAKEMRHGDSDA